MRNAYDPLLSAFCLAKRWNIDLQRFGGDAAAAPAQAGPETGAPDGEAAASAGAADPGEKLSHAQRRQDAAAGAWHRAAAPAVPNGGREAGERAAAAPLQTEEKRPPADAPGATAAAAGQSQSKDAAFERLIRGEYKEQFAARTQRIIDMRFRAAKEQAAESGRDTELVRRLAGHFGVDAADREALARAAGLEPQTAAGKSAGAGAEPDKNPKDGSAAPAAAPGRAEEPAGSAEKTGESGGPDAEHGEAPDDGADAAAGRAAERILQGWESEGRALAAIYPDFSLETAVRDPDFTRLLQSGVSVRRAYEACHLDTLLGGAMQYTADKVAQGLAGRLAARAARPAENGTTPLAGAVVRTDVNSLTRAERDEIERRVAHGERIRF